MEEQNNIVLIKDYLPNGFYQFSCKMGGKLIADINLKLDTEFSESNFDVKFNFKDYLLVCSELNLDSIVKIQNSKTILQRIEEYKKINYQYKPIYKLIIYACEYAVSVYKIESNILKKINIVIDSFKLSFGGISKSGILYTVVNAIWDLLDFTPKTNLSPKVSQQKSKIFPNMESRSIFDVELPHSIQTKYVSRDVLIDESLTDHHLNFEDDLYEKGRKYQWLI